MQKIIVGVLAFLAAANARLSLNPVPYYDFLTPCTGQRQNNLPTYICKQENYEGVPYVVSAVGHEILAVPETAEHQVSCNSRCQLPLGEGGVSPFSFSLGLTVDNDGTFFISNTGTGPGSEDYGSVWTCAPGANQATRLWRATSPSGLPSGLDYHRQLKAAFLSSETDGRIYTIYSNGTSVVFADPQTPGYELLSGISGILGLGGSVENSNLFGAPFGSVALSISPDGKTLFVGSAERGLILSIEIKRDGAAGRLRTISASPEHMIEGVYYDTSRKTVFFGSVFRNATSLVPDGPNGQYNGGVRAGNAVWSTDLRTGTTERFYDERLGAVCSVNKVPSENDKLFVVSSGFDTFFGWPLGNVRSGTESYPAGPGQIPPGPALFGPHNAKIWKAQIQ